MSEQKRKFTVIDNKEYREESFHRERMRSYQTNPLNIQGQSLKEQFMKFTNGEAGRRFSVEDLLRGC